MFEMSIRYPQGEVKLAIGIHAESKDGEYIDIFKIHYEYSMSAF